MTPSEKRAWLEELKRKWALSKGDYTDWHKLIQELEVAWAKISELEYSLESMNSLGHEKIVRAEAKAEKIAEALEKALAEQKKMICTADRRPPTQIILEQALAEYNAWK